MVLPSGLIFNALVCLISGIVFTFQYDGVWLVSRFRGCEPKHSLNLMIAVPFDRMVAIMDVQPFVRGVFDQLTLFACGYVTPAIE